MVPALHAALPSPSSRSGRTSFYEEYGVIRDVLQNHLTEVLTLVAMELPYNASSAEAVLQHKLQAFRALRGLRSASAVLGQYRAYGAQVRRELHKPDSFHSLTPTFAGGRPAGPGLRLPRPRPRPQPRRDARLPLRPSTSLEQQVAHWRSLGDRHTPSGGLRPAHGGRSFRTRQEAQARLPPSWRLCPAPR